MDKIKEFKIYMVTLVVSAYFAGVYMGTSVDSLIYLLLKGIGYLLCLIEIALISKIIKRDYKIIVEPKTN